MLQAVFRLSQDGSEVHTAQVAAQLQLAPGAVTMNIKRLADRGILFHRPYVGVGLTAMGRLAAMSAVRRHRVVETFLVEQLGYPLEDAMRLSPSFEFHIPQEVEDRMFSVLGHPETCPHGNQIPAPATSEFGQPVRLTDLTPGDAAVIALPNDLDGEVVAFLDTLGVKPGVQIELREKSPADGPVVVRVNGQDRTVGEQLADRIQVVPGIRVKEEAV